MLVFGFFQSDPSATLLDNLLCSKEKAELRGGNARKKAALVRGQL